MLLIWEPGPLLAQEIFFKNGFYLGMGANASFTKRQKNINYCGRGSGPFNLTSVKDVTASPALTLGYILNEANSVILRGDWAHYSLSRSFLNPAIIGFSSCAIEGSLGFGVIDTPVKIDLDWKSNVYNLELEYQRLLWAYDPGGLIGLLGFKYRYEEQNFEASAGPFDQVDEKLREHLFGPYAGVRLSFKPGLSSSASINVKASFGYLFKSADFRARQTLVGQSFAVNDSSSKGTIFSVVGLDFIYAISKNWSVDVGYGFNWINEAAHIFNNSGLLPVAPSRIVDSSIITHTIGMKVSYKF